MAQAVSRRPRTAEARIRSRFSPCGICGGHSGTGTDFFPEYFGFPLSMSFHLYSITWKNGKTNHLSLDPYHKGCTISLKATGRPLGLLRGPTPQKKKSRMGLSFERRIFIVV
jgi:hypothetical protein